MVEKELRFVATPEQGAVSALLARPEGTSHLLVLGHGASTTMRHATLHAVDTADHGYKVLKCSRVSKEDIFAEMARVVREWAAGLR
jgi:hypothetical protein